MKSRKIYDFFVKELQESYSLQIRDGQSTSVASFLVLGGQDPQMYRQK